MKQKEHSNKEWNIFKTENSKMFYKWFCLKKISFSPKKLKASKFFQKSNKLHPQEKTQKYYEMAEHKKKGNNNHQDKKSPTKKEKEHHEEIPQKQYTKQQAHLNINKILNSK